MRPMPVLEAISHIVIGQMLSRKVTKKIIDKARALSDEKKLPGISYLAEHDLKNCGISSRKAKTIQLFSQHYQQNVEKIENWRYLDAENLYIEVNRHWGLSYWSASMLGIFYFGMEDIFPFEDGSINRAMNKFKSLNIYISPQLVIPYRSYLALYLWKILDDNLI
jgi:DNA-3-methyladenine glycosylase II